MVNFVNDYSEGCVPEILEALAEQNYVKNTGYGCDPICEAAAKKIKKACKAKEADVYFLTGGTQTNMIVIDTMTERFDGVVAADTGHVNTHEAGAIEHSGHKVLTLPNHNGKIRAADLKGYIEDYYADDNFEHMARPGIVYISHPTEVGTLYTKEELKEIHSVCKSYNIPLFLDGARLAYGITAKGTDVTLADIAKYTDVFYVGGTKCGALYGEAVVWPRGGMPFRFDTLVKQKGAMVAKGWLIGLQFDALFSEVKEGGSKISVYERGGIHANLLADKIKKALKKKGYKFFVQSPTNQIFVLADKEKMAELSKEAEYSFFAKYNDKYSIIRFVTSWASTEEDVDRLVEVL